MEGSAVKDALALTLPPESLDELAAGAAELVLEQLGPVNGSPWMTRAQAADYLGLPLSRLEKDPHPQPPRRGGGCSTTAPSWMSTSVVANARRLDAASQDAMLGIYPRNDSRDGEEKCDARETVAEAAPDR